MEIRDSKLYKQTHGTFEAYCKERWDIVRSRAYELIDQAKVADALTAVGVDLSAKTDISKRDVIALKADLPAAAAEIKSRIDQGEGPVQALVATVSNAREQNEKARADRSAEQAKNDAVRQQTQDALSDAVKAQESAKQAAIEATKARKREQQSGLTDADRIAELEEENRVLVRDYQEVVTENKKFGDMRVLFDKGGFEAVIASKDEQIRVVKDQFHNANRDMIAWKNKANWWREQAVALGWKGKDEGDAA
jgi:hypothetical protein